MKVKFYFLNEMVNWVSLNKVKPFKTRITSFFSSFINREKGEMLLIWIQFVLFVLLGKVRTLSFFCECVSTCTVTHWRFRIQIITCPFSALSTSGLLNICKYGTLFSYCHLCICRLGIHLFSVFSCAQFTSKQLQYLLSYRCSESYLFVFNQVLWFFFFS